MRIKELELKRPFKIPLGTKGIIAISIPPILLAIAALFTNGADYLFWGIMAAVSGPIAYFICRSSYGGLGKNSSKEQTNPKTKLAFGDTTRYSVLFAFLHF